MAADRTATRVVLLDDHPVVRHGLAGFLRDEGFDVVGVAATGADALAMLTQRPVDALVLDLSLDGEAGGDLLPRLRAVSPATNVVVYSVHEDSERIRSLFEGGARGYVTKREDPEVLAQGIAEVCAGARFLSPRAARAVAEALGREPALDPDAVLSPQERQVYDRLGVGQSTQEIARSLGLSGRTVETYYGRMLAKLDLPGRRELRLHATREARKPQTR